MEQPNAPNKQTSLFKEIFYLGILIAINIFYKWFIWSTGEMNIAVYLIGLLLDFMTILKATTLFIDEAYRIVTDIAVVWSTTEANMESRRRRRDASRNGDSSGDEMPSNGDVIIDDEAEEQEHE